MQSVTGEALPSKVSEKGGETGEITNELLGYHRNFHGNQ